MSYLDRLHHNTTPKHGLLPHVVEAVEYGGFSYLYGYAQNRWRDQLHVKGVPADLLTGLALKAVVVGADIFDKGGHGVMSLVDNAANAGIGAFFHTMGAGHGAQKSGMKRLLVSASDAEKVKKVLPSATILGEIPKAPHGDFLSTRELQDLAK